MDEAGCVDGCFFAGYWKNEKKGNDVFFFLLAIEIGVYALTPELSMVDSRKKPCKHPATCYGRPKSADEI